STGVPLKRPCLTPPTKKKSVSVSSGRSSPNIFAELHSRPTYLIDTRVSISPRFLGRGSASDNVEHAAAVRLKVRSIQPSPRMEDVRCFGFRRQIAGNGDTL